MPDDILSIARPALQKRVGELIDEAFKLAQYIQCLDTLEGAINNCTSKYFGTDTVSDTYSEEQEPQKPCITSFDNGRNTRVRKNLVATTVSIPEMSPPTHKNMGLIRKRKKRDTLSYLPGNRIKAYKYSNAGRPISRFMGVSYSGSLQKPWMVRYHETRMGNYQDEVSAAKAYDQILISNGEEPINFPNTH